MPKRAVQDMGNTPLDHSPGETPAGSARSSVGARPWQLATRRKGFCDMMRHAHGRRRPYAGLWLKRLEHEGRGSYVRPHHQAISINAAQREGLLGASTHRATLLPRRPATAPYTAPLPHQQHLNQAASQGAHEYVQALLCLLWYSWQRQRTSGSRVGSGMHFAQCSLVPSGLSCARVRVR